MINKTNKIYLLTALLIIFIAPGFSQDNKLRFGGTTGDSVNCGVHLSGYREFMKINLFKIAREPWLKAFDNCQESSKRMYIDGVTLYRYFIEEAPAGPVREGLIDTLLLIYDRRIENFGDEGNVLGRKGKDLLAYRNSDIEQVQNAYEMLETSIEIEGNKSQESVLLLFITAGIALNKADKLEDNQVIDNYITLSGMLGQLEKRSSRWGRTRAKLDEIMLKENILSCEALDNFYGTQFEQNKNDKNFLENIIALYRVSGCDRSNIYVSASEELYSIDPSPESAHNLGIMFINKNDNKKAADYLIIAVLGENIDTETRAQWYYELALVSLAIEDHCEAIKYAREAINLKEDFSKVYILLGDAFIASRNNLGDDFQQRTVYWTAADKYRKAARINPSLDEETRQKLNDGYGQYPNSEELFFRDLKEGDSYLVGGCINENTTVQPGK